MKRSPIRKRSTKMEEKYILRRALVRRLLAERPECEACLVYGRRAVRASTDLHEIKNRSQGGDILDEDQILCVCRSCHDRIGNYPSEAEYMGLHVPGWARDEHISETAQIRLSFIMGLPVIPTWME